MGVEVPSLAQYGRWRSAAGKLVVGRLALYGRYCSGQFSGMGEALSMSAVRFLCESEDIPREGWADLTEEMVLIHGAVMERARASKGNG